MIILRVGEDFTKREKYDKKMPRSDEILSGENILTLYKYLDRDLFGESKNIKIEDWDKVEYRDFIYKNIEDMVNSVNTFVFDELKVLPATVQKFERNGATVFNCVAPENKFDIFAFLRDVLVDKSKSKKDIWIKFLKLKENVNFEEFFGVATWYISDAISKKYFSKYGEEKMKDIFYKLILIKDGGYKEGEDMWVKVERLLLEM